MRLTNEYYKRIAASIVLDEPLELRHFDLRGYEFEEADAFPKQRPRKGKGGVFTPPETRKYEALVKQWGIEVGMKPVAYPIGVQLTIRDYTDDIQKVAMSSYGMEYNARGDLDNYAKAILDGLNKVMMQDDRQIVELHVSRIYSSRKGFALKVWRAGLSANELEQLKKFMR